VSSRPLAEPVTDLQKDLEQAIARILKPLGYAKRGATWHRDRDALVSVLNLQKSQWGEDWYLNLGVYLKRLGDEARPSEARCHVRCRASSLSGREVPRDPAALAAMVEEVAVPWPDGLSTEEGVATFLASEFSTNCFVYDGVRKTISEGSRAPSVKVALDSTHTAIS
jgi:hypothetical protein